MHQRPAERPIDGGVAAGLEGALLGRRGALLRLQETAALGEKAGADGRADAVRPDAKHQRSHAEGQNASAIRNHVPALARPNESNAAANSIHEIGALM